jgi:hypothetical protein
MLFECLRNALILAFGAAVAFAIIGLIFAALAGVLAGPGIEVVVAALIGPILLGAGIVFAAGFIQAAINCIIAAGQAQPDAAAPAGAEQPLDEDDEGRPWPKCRLCRWWQKYITWPASAAAAVVALLIMYGK